MTEKEAENQIRELLERVPQIVKTLEENKEKLADQEDLIRKLKEDIKEICQKVDQMIFENITGGWKPNKIHQQWQKIKKDYINQTKGE